MNQKSPNMSKTALIVDDEEALCEIIVEILSTIDITGYFAVNGNEAIELAKQHDHFDLLILDENMPGLSGAETYNELKQSYPNSPLILMSGYSMNDTIESLNLSCPYKFVKKPFSIAELSQTVLTLIS